MISSEDYAFMAKFDSANSSDARTAVIRENPLQVLFFPVFVFFCKCLIHCPNILFISKLIISSALRRL